MSEDWKTKYGTRRVRRDPPTLDEAIFAAVGITDDQEAQAEIAASLMGLPIEQVQAEVKKASRVTAGRSTTRVIAGEQGAQRCWRISRCPLRAILSKRCSHLQQPPRPSNFMTRANSRSCDFPCMAALLIPILHCSIGMPSYRGMT